MRGRERRNERIQGIYRAMEPFRAAKKKTIRSLGSIGRKHKYLRYPIFIGLVAFIFIYNVFFHAFIQFKIRERMARAMAVAMTVIMVLTSIDLSVLALTLEKQGYYNLTAYETEPSSIMVPIGTPIEEIELPDSVVSTLDFYVIETMEEEEGVESEVPSSDVVLPESTETPADVEVPESTETPTDAEMPESTEIPADAEVPESTETPADAEVPESTETPADAGMPESTEPPADAEMPESTETPVDVEVPESTETPADAEVPESTETPADAEVPESTETPVDAAVPESTETPADAADSTQTTAVEETYDNGADTTIETTTVSQEQFYTGSGANHEVQILTSENTSEDVITSEKYIESDMEESEVSEVTSTDISETEESEEILINEVFEETIIAEVPVTWVCDQYDANTLGEYVFTAQFPAEYKGCELRIAADTLPTLTVQVVEAQIVIGNQTIDGIEIELKAAPGVFPEGAVLSVSKVTDEETVAMIESTIQQEIDANKKDEEDQTTIQSTVTFDIVVLDSEGNEIQPDIPKGMTEQEAICVTFKQVVPVLEVECEEDEITNMQVYHVEDSYDAVELLESGTSEADVFFSPEHFSYYSCACTHSNYKSVSSWRSLYKAIYNQTGTINIKLTSDIEIEKLLLYSNSNRIYIHKGQTVNIDLNGYDITSETGKEAVELKKGTLNIHDRKGTGTISAEDGSRVIYITGNSTFNLMGGTIQKSGKESWGVDVVSAASVNISGGRINGSFSTGIWASASYDVDIKMTGGTINGASTGIYFGGSGSNNGSINMTGGTISNSTSAGIYNGGTTLTLSGGTINGHSSYKAYGVQVTGTYAKINLSGSPQFSNNRAADIYVGSYTNNRINVTGTLSGSNIGISTATTPTDAAPVQFTSASSYVVANMNKFYSKASSSYGVWNPDTTSYLVTGPMGNRTITAEMVFVETNPATNANGEVAKIALGSATAVTSNASAKDISTVVKFNTPMTFNATLVDSTNYEFKGWRKAGTTTILSTSPTYTFDAKDNLNLEAVFARKTCTITIKTSAVSMGTVAITTSAPAGTGITTNTSAGTITGTFEMGSVITATATAKEVTSSNPKAYYKLSQWSDGVEGTTSGLVTTREITVSGDGTYIAQFRYPDPDPNATGTLFIGVEQLKPSAYCYTSIGETKPSKVILIGTEYGEMANTQGGTLAIAGLPGNSARLSILEQKTTVYRAENNGTPNTLGQAESYYDGVYANADCADSASAHGSTTSTSAMGIHAHGNTANSKYSSYTSSIPSAGFGYYVCIDLITANNVWSSGNLYKGDAFDNCPGGWIAYSSTCGRWHYWCNNGGVKGAGPYYAYAYDKAVQFTAWEKDAQGQPVSSNITVKVNDLKLGEGTDQNYIESADVTVTIKATDGNYYTLANAVFTGESGSGVPAGAVIDFENGDRVIEFNLNGVAFNHTLPEAIIASGTGENETRTEYTYIRDALSAAKDGDVIYVYGPAISEISGSGVTVAEGVKIISYDGTEISLNQQSTLNAQKDGTIELIQGTMTATPKDDASDVEVSVTGATVTSKEEITVSTDASGQGQVSTQTEGADIKISPDGDSSHTVVFEGCVADKEYGVHSGEMTTENKVTISSGTEYELEVPLGESEKVIQTDPANTGSTTITKGKDEDGNNTVIIDAEKPNDTVVVETPVTDENGNSTTISQTYTTSEEKTKLVVSETSDDVVLESGGVNVPNGGSIMLPSGEKIQNNSGTGSDDITISVDENNKESIVIPGGSSAKIGDTVVSVPAATGEEPSNLPVQIELKEDGAMDVTAKSGNEVIIGGETYEIGDYDAVFEINPDADPEEPPVVKEGTVVLQPGQSITDANGVTYSNPATEPGEEPKTLQITMAEGQDSEVTVEPGQSFEFTPAGAEEPIVYDNPGSSDTSFVITPDGDVSLGSDIALGGGDEVDVELGGTNSNVMIPEGNSGNISVDPIEGNIVIGNAGGKVVINEETYVAGSDNTVLKPGEDGVELSSGSVILGGDSEVIVNGSKVENTGDSDCGVSVGNDGQVSVSVPEDGSFTLSDPDSKQSISVTNPTNADKSYTIDQSGALIVPEDSDVTFEQNGEQITVSAPEDGNLAIVPTEDGVEITAPEGGDVTINGQTYENAGAAEDGLTLVVNPNGDTVLMEGTTILPEGGSILLPGGETNIQSADGSVTVDADGNIVMPDGSSATITGPDGSVGSYTADGDVKLEYNPETGIPVIDKSSAGSVVLGEGSKIDIVYDSVVEKDEDGDESYPEDLKATITNTGNTGATVLPGGDILVPQDGSVTIESIKTLEDGTQKVVKNEISVPNGSVNDSVTTELNKDGSVNVTVTEENGTVNVNGMEYTTGANTEINISENGNALVSGSVALDGKDESIIVNGTKVTNSGAGNASIDVAKNDDGTVGLEVGAGAQFELAVPGAENSAVIFENTGDAAANYTVNTDGSIGVNNGTIGFTTSTGTEVEVGSTNGDIKLKVTENGVELSAPAGTDIVINGKTYSNSGGDLVIVLDAQGNPVLKEGSATIPSGGSISLPNGNVISSQSGDVTVGQDGSVSVPSGATATIVSADGTSNSYKASEAGADILTAADNAVPVLNSGSVELAEGSEICADGSVIKGTGVNAPIVNADGSVQLPAGGNSGVIIQETITDGTGATQTTETEINVPAGNQGAVSIDENAEGEIEVSVANQEDRVDINGAVYESNSDEETKIAITDEGNELVSGGVALDGNSAQEGIIVNGTEVTNIGSGTVDVNKNADGTVGLNVSEGSRFELAVPGVEDSAVAFENTGEGPADYTVNTDGSIAVNDGSSITYTTDDDVEVTVSGKADDEENADITFKVTEDGVALDAPEGTDIVINGQVYENVGEAGEDLEITVDSDGNAVLTGGTAGLKEGGAIQLPNGNIVAGENGDIQVDDAGNVSMPSGATATITSPDGTSSNSYTAIGGDAVVETDSDVPVLNGGSVSLADGSVIKAGESVIKGTGDEAAIVNTDGSVVLPAGSAMIIENEVADGNGGTEKITGVVGADENNSGSITVNSDANGNPVITVEKQEDKVNVNGIVYETTEDETEITITEDGNELTDGGVSLDGGDYAEKIIVNGTEVSNTSSNGAVVDVTKKTEGTSLTVGAGGQFELAVPGDNQSAVSFGNEGTEDAEYAVNSDGSIGIEGGSSISFETDEGEVIQVSGTGAVNEEDADITLKVTEGGVQLTAPEGTNLKINDTIYENAGGAGEALSMTVDGQGNKIISSGAAAVPAGDRVYVADTNGNTIEVSKDGDASDSSITVSSDGKIDANIGDTIQIGDGSYTCNDTYGEFDLTVNPETGEVIVNKGAELEIQNGNVTLVDSEDPNRKVSVSTTGDKPIEILNTGNAEPEITIPAGGNASITNKNGEVIEVIIPEAEEGVDDSAVSVTVDDSGNLSVELKAGEKVVIGGVEYTAEQDGVLKVDGATGDVVESNIGTAIPVIDPELFNKENYQYELEPGEQVYVGDVLYTAQDNNSGSVILGGNADGNPIVTIEEDADSVKVGDNTYTADSANTKFEVNDTEDGSPNVTLVDNGSATENSSLALRSPNTLTVDGNTYTANGTGNAKAATISKTADGNKINVMTGADVSVDMGTDTDLEVVGNDTFTIGDVPYTAPAGGMTLSGNAEGNPTITLPNEGESVRIGNESYTAGSDDTQFVVNEPGNVTLVDNGNAENNSSLVINGNSTLVVDGNTITAGGNAGDSAYEVTKKDSGVKIDVADGADVSLELGTNSEIEVAGNDTVKIDDVPYTAPTSGMVLTDNPDGNPMITIQKDGETVKVGDDSYTAAADDTRFIVNGEDDVTLVDNGSTGANSSLAVTNPSSLVVDGNKIVSTGAAGGGYVIEKTESGNSIEISPDTKVSVSMGEDGAKLTINEPVQYNGQSTGSNTTTLQPSAESGEVVIDKTQADASGNYIANIMPAEGTEMTPVVDENGNIIGFVPSVIIPEPDEEPDEEPNEEPDSELEAEPGTEPESKPEPAPDTETEEEPESKPESDESSGSSGGHHQEDSSEEIVEIEIPDNQEPESEIPHEEEEFDEEVTEDTSEETEEEHEDTLTEEVVVIETVEDTEGVTVIDQMRVQFGKGNIDIRVEGDGLITSDLNSLLYACFTEEELENISDGGDVAIRLTIVKDDNPDKTAYEEIKDSYRLYEGEISGFVLADTYVIVVERRMGDSDWEVLHELNRALELTVEIPEEILADGRTYFMVRNHQGQCTLLPDIDESNETITVSTADFSVYAIMYTDEDVTGLDLDELNAIILSGEHGRNLFPWILIVIGVCVITAFGIFIIIKRRKDEEEEITL